MATAELGRFHVVRTRIILGAKQTHVADTDLYQGPWYATAKFWKRSSVFLSIALSAASLILSSVASLSPEHESALNGITPSPIYV
jgi:hypothetical protein